MIEIAVFGAGCLWHVQDVFDGLDGVVSTRVGYSGGRGNSGYGGIEDSGHAEAIEVKFDSKRISYRKLLDVFWREHDPTLKNRQGLDIGSRYRSVIFYGNDKQKREAMESRERVKKRLLGNRGFFSNLLGERIITEIVKMGKFYEAEEEHQDYYKKHGKTC